MWLAFPQLFRGAQIDLHQFLRSLSFSSVFVEGACPILYLGWALEYEMISYLAFAVAIFAGDIRLAVAACGVMLTVAFLWLPLEAVVFEFLFGVGLGLVYDHP